MFNIVLVHPQIPQNVGAIGRLCVNAGFTLHIVKPIVFEITEKSLRRAGLDYWKKLDPKIWKSDEEFLSANYEYKDRFFFSTTKTRNLYYNAEFKPKDFLIFGSESYGLPPVFMNLNPSNQITIPMTDEGRSLNLAMAVGIVGYEAIRQNLDNFKIRL